MILHQGKCLCVLCGVEIDVAPHERTLVTMVKSSGRKTYIRTVMLGSKELHACPMGTAWEKRSRG
jgi:hypothetical protein